MQDVQTKLRRELDRCVKCGLCLPECPTYRIEANENASPRGRLALIEGWAGGRLDADQTLVDHLDRCLGCRRCERVCPSQVAFGQIIDDARAGMRPSSLGLLDRVVRRPGALRTAIKLARALPDAAFGGSARLRRLRRLADALPAVQTAPGAGEYPALSGPPRGRVGLFLGCATAAQQGATLHAALELLRQLGFTVVVPARATCCGAMARHHGDATTAARLLDSNRRAFDTGLNAVVTIASGCGSHLDEQDPGLAVPHHNICDFLLGNANLQRSDFEPLRQAVLLHTPCSVENRYRGGHWAAELLAMIPELRVERLGEPGQCCGSAGDYLLRYPHTAERLRQPLLDQTKATSAIALLTSNIGCALHLAQGMAEQGNNITVEHPVDLLHRQFRAARHRARREQR